MAKEGQLIVEELIFNDYTLLVAQWLESIVAYPWY